MIAESTTSDVIIAAIVAISTTMVGLVPLWLWMAKNRRQRVDERAKAEEQRRADLLTAALERAEMKRMLEESHRTVKDTYEAVNRVSEDEQVPDGDAEVRPTLGSVLRDVQREMRTGFARNDEDHAALGRVIDAHGDLLHQQGQRIDVLRDDVQGVEKALVEHSEVDARIEGKVDQLRGERDG